MQHIELRIVGGYLVDPQKCRFMDKTFTDI